MRVHIGMQTVPIKLSNALQRILYHEIASQMIFMNFKTAH